VIWRGNLRRLLGLDQCLDDLETFHVDQGLVGFFQLVCAADQLMIPVMLIGMVYLWLSIMCSSAS